MTKAEDRLWCQWQDGRGLVRYVEDFLELTNQVSWIDASLYVCFRLGLDDDIISCDRSTCSFSLIKLIHLVLFLNDVNLEVEEIQSDHHPTPPGNHQASPAHPSPGPSTHPAKCPNHQTLPSTTSVLSPQPSAASTVHSRARSGPGAHRARCGPGAHRVHSRAHCGPGAHKVHSIACCGPGPHRVHPRAPCSPGAHTVHSRS